MATHSQNKISMGVSADLVSSELSFAGLLSVQDLQPQTPPPTNSTAQMNKQNQEFVYGHHTRGSKKNGSADKSITTGNIQLQTLLYQSQQIKVTQKPGSRDAAHSNDKRSSGNETQRKKVTYNPHETRNQVKQELATPRSSSGQKGLCSFLSPCKECHADTPDVKNSHRKRRSKQAK